jgi:hypothetical protein
MNPKLDLCISDSLFQRTGDSLADRTIHCSLADLLSRFIGSLTIMGINKEMLGVCGCILPNTILTLIPTFDVIDIDLCVSVP